MVTAQKIEQGVRGVTDRSSFLQGLLAETLEWPIPEEVEQLDDIGYGWTADDLRAQGLEAKLLDGQVWQIQLRHGQPWGVFVVEFAQDQVYRTVLRRVLRGLVPSRRRGDSLPAWNHENLLFLCATRDYNHITFAHFRGKKAQTARLATFGWRQGDTHLRTLCAYNLPQLAWPEDDGRDSDAWLKQWARAFDIEAVTKRFFADYRGVFETVEGAVAGLPLGEPRRLYVQRLFNRLMFLYFIQRKGWLSFQGDKKYLRALFNAATAAGEDFLNERLYWTFFAGLNTLMEDEALHAHVNLKERRGEVPFLNGGLFDLEDEYDVRDAVKVPNAAFAAVLDLFDRYNFTVTESTPFDVEVAVDPEMLGKVFEELVTGRHESGSYYTPRPVVAFMCREALKHYLSPVGGGEEAVAGFVDDGDPSKLPDPETVLNALRSVKVCDPACGSGAYLLGMMQELLRLREALFVASRLDGVTVYNRKLEIIERNLYGVDLDLFAVNIAKLRLWLSLAVDFEGGTPKPLPNLDFKIERGDSLTAPDPQEIPDLFRNLLVEGADRLAEMKGEYLQTYGANKKELAERIKAEEAKLRAGLNEHSPEDSVDWRVAFAEVFRNGGFDIALANPPYVRQELIKDIKPKLKTLFTRVYDATADLYIYFYARAMQILRGHGVLAFIAPNKFFRAAYGQKLRQYLAKHSHLQTILDFRDFPIFEATTYPAILVAEKVERLSDTARHEVRTYTWTSADLLNEIRENVYTKGTRILQSELGAGGWHLEAGPTRRLLDKVRAAGQRLGNLVGDRIHYGLKTGLNQAFVIDTDTRDQLISEDSNSAEIIRPFLRGRDVKRWMVRFSERYLIWTYVGVPIKRYPAVFRHLKQYQRQLEKRQDQGDHWWELRACAYYDEFEKPKIIYPDIFQHQSFAYDPDDHLMVNTLYFMPEADSALLGILNSELMEFYYARISNQIRGGYRRSFTQYIKELPIIPPTKDIRDKVAKLLRLAKSDGPDSPSVRGVESDINEMVYKLYELRADDIRLVREDLASTQQQDPKQIRKSSEYQEYIKEIFEG